MLSPKRTKYRKRNRSSASLTGNAHRGNTIAFGDFGLVALEPKWITNRQIEAARVAMTRTIKRGGKVWIRIFPDMPYTKKPAETRMGKAWNGYVRNGWYLCRTGKRGYGIGWR